MTPLGPRMQQRGVEMAWMKICPRQIQQGITTGEDWWWQTGQQEGFEENIAEAAAGVSEQQLTDTRAN